MTCADVLLPLYLSYAPTYGVDDALAPRLSPGCRVVVELGKGKFYTGIVTRIYQTESDPERRLKPVLRMLDGFPAVTSGQLELWRWIAAYYMATPGECMKQFFPKALRSTAAAEGVFRPGAGVERVRRVEKADSASWEELEARFARAPQKRKTLRLVQEAGGEMDYRELREKGIASAIIKSLTDGGVLSVREENAPRSFGVKEHFNSYLYDLPELTPAQEECRAGCEAALQAGKPALLYGVAGAGKTEVYFTLIGERLRQGKSVLLLVPELALTTQLTDRIRACFGKEVVSYTSQLTEKQRYDNYLRVLSGSGVLVVGTRIAVGLPFRDLGLVVVDEEHDPNYKQTEPPPRFHARDAALVLARQAGAGVLLVSATPSLESFYHAKSGRYGLVTLSRRFDDMPAPRITVIDRRGIALEEKRLYGYRFDTRYFSKYLLRRMQETFARGGQAVLLQNRRGFASYIECGDCGDVPGCPHCHVTLTFHRERHALECHYCGYRVPARNLCPACGGKNMVLHGIGTENLEAAAAHFFPDTERVRIDVDALKSRSGVREALDRIASGEVGIILGTQMVCKGFDFPKVELSAAIDADNLIRFPDFRAGERAFQLLTQLAGRTSRAGQQGEMVLQTAAVDDPLVREIRQGDYVAMFGREIEERRKFGYPPFVRLVKLILRARDPQYLEEAAGRLAQQLRERLGDMICGPDLPLVDKVRGYHMLNILVKIPRNGSPAAVKEGIAAAVRSEPKLYVALDVDPQ